MKLNDIKIIIEDMKPYDFLKDADAAVELFNSQMQSEFGEDFYTKAKVSKVLGAALDFKLFHTAVKVTRHNSPVHVELIMHLTNNSGKLVDRNNFEIEILQLTSELRKAGVKFRKIKEKSPLEATKKLVAWFKKYKPQIMEVFATIKKD